MNIAVANRPSSPVGIISACVFDHFTVQLVHRHFNTYTAAFRAGGTRSVVADPDLHFGEQRGTSTGTAIEGKPYLGNHADLYAEGHRYGSCCCTVAARPDLVAFLGEANHLQSDCEASFRCLPVCARRAHCTAGGYSADIACTTCGLAVLAPETAFKQIVSV
ncbi:hypothetical protein ACXX9E_29740 [Pseudomonas sp. GNP014]